MDDLISRQAVKEWLGRWEGYLDKDMISRMQLKVNDIPTHPTPSNTLGALDCVDRQAAINAIESLDWYHQNRNKDMVSGANSALHQPWYKSQDVYDALEKLPSVQPTQLTDEDKETIRIHLSAFKEKLCNQRRWNEAKEYEDLITRLLSTTSVHLDKDLIHLQKEQAYMQGYEDGRKSRKGKWHGKGDSEGFGIFICDNCGKFAMMEYDFCPSCGADMRQRSDSDDNE